MGQVSVLPPHPRVFPVLLVGIYFLQPIKNRHTTDPVPNLPNEFTLFWNCYNFNLMIKS